jgi:hypothetical protein
MIPACPSHVKVGKTAVIIMSVDWNLLNKLFGIIDPMPSSLEARKEQPGASGLGKSLAALGRSAWQEPSSGEKTCFLSWTDD